MKKRITAICLALVMLLCALPFAAAAESVEPEMFVHLENHLLQTGYPLEENETEIAVGDTLSVYYRDNVPATLYCNGEKVYEFPAGEGNYYDIPVKQTGKIELSLMQGDQQILHRTVKVIASKDMYPKNVKALFSYLGTIKPDWFFKDMTEEELKSGGWLVAPFFPIASFYMLLGELIQTVFSFTRIVR